LFKTLPKSKRKYKSVTLTTNAAKTYNPMTQMNVFTQTSVGIALVT
jgi:hypothetical protein